ncbi:MAG: sulfotransferase family protein [Bradymonadaceae bacterium]
MTTELPQRAIPYFWDQYARKYRVLLKNGQSPASVLGEAGFRMGLWAANQIGWTLDDLLEPAWRDVRLEGPIFILGHQRSGTTFLHRLLIEDALCGENGAVGMTMAQMVLPSFTMRRGLDALIAPVKERILAWEDQKMQRLDDIHYGRFHLIGEDEVALWSIFASAMCANDSPISSYARGLEPLRRVEDWPIGSQRAVMRWYRSCLMKAIRDAGQDEGIFVSKNPAFTKRIDLLLAEFPEAKFVYLIRNPLETIPSRLSLIEAIWQSRFPEFETLEPEHVQAIVADSRRIYLEGEEGLKGIPSERLFVLPYKELIADPGGRTRELLEHFGFEASPGLDDALRRREANRIMGKKNRRYGLGDYGLCEEDIRRDLAPVFARYGF